MESTVIILDGRFFVLCSFGNLVRLDWMSASFRPSGCVVVGWFGFEAVTKVLTNQIIPVKKLISFCARI